MSLADVLVCLLRQEGKVTCWDHFTEDGLGPLFSRLVLVLDLKILANEARCCLNYLDDLMLQNEELSGN